VDVAGLAPQIIRQDVAEIVDGAANGGIETVGTADVGELLSLQHQLRDESLSLQAVLKGYSLNDEAYDQSTRAVTLDQISKYMEIGSATLEFFSEDINDLLKAHSEQVFRVAEDLARAKTALAVSSAEAEWYLSLARTEMRSLAD
jgi:hypothetical protein